MRLTALLLALCPLHPSNLPPHLDADCWLDGFHSDTGPWNRRGLVRVIGLAFLSVCLSVCLPLYLSTWLSISIPVSLSLRLTLPTYLWNCLSVSFSLPLYLSTWLSVSIHVCLSLSLSASVCLSICLSVSLSVCPPSPPTHSVIFFIRGLSLMNLSIMYHAWKAPVWM